MTSRIAIAACAAALAIAGVAAGAAESAKTLSAAAPGMWELTGVQGSKTPARECLPSLGTLAQYEHRAMSCSVKPLSDTGKLAVFTYTCGQGNFGRTSIKLVTPRNLKVDTQGIADGLPFAYTIEARRTGECKAGAGAGGAVERGH